MAISTEHLFPPGWLPVLGFCPVRALLLICLPWAWGRCDEQAQELGQFLLKGDALHPVELEGGSLWLKAAR